MATLQNRVSALEKVQPSAEPMTIIRRIVSPGNLQPDYNHIRAADGTEWERLPGESEQDFIDRATRLVNRNEYGNAQLIVSESKEPSHANH
jgi:hypothetical protein